jgi:hypothetical protein
MAQAFAVSFLIESTLDRLVDRATEALAEPFLVRRALAELRSPSHTMHCSIGVDITPRLEGLTWQVGRAVIAPGRLVFLAGVADQVRFSFAVRAVVRTTYARRRGDGDLGPRILGVRVLHTSEGKVFWSAHRRLLVEASAVLCGER